MDDTTRSIIESIAINYDRPTSLPGGHMGTIFYDTVRLTGNDLARLAAAAAGHLAGDHFDVAVGMAYSGIFFAVAVAGGRQVALVQADGKIFGAPIKGRRVVLVDDVICTGKRLRTGEERVKAEGAEVMGFITIVNRMESAANCGDKPVWSAFQADLNPNIS